MVAAVVAAPWLTTSGFVLDFITLTLFVAILGQGWNLLGGFGGQFSFGHAVFFGVGAYTQIIMQTKLGWTAWAAIPAALAASVTVGAFIGFLSFRYGLRGPYFALVTLAFAEAARVLAISLDITDGGQGIYLALNRDPERAFTSLQFASITGYYYAAALLCAMSIAVAWLVQRSRFGARLVAVRENEEAAAALGIDAFRVKMSAMCLSAAVTASAGVFYAQKFLYLDPGIAFGPGKSVEALVVSIVGGMGTVLGPLAGAVVLHGIGEATKVLSHLAWQDRPGIDLVIYGVVLILILRFLPQGLIGLSRALWFRARR